MACLFLFAFANSIIRYLPLDRLPPAAANKKTPVERKHVLAGVRFTVTERCNASREGTVSCFDGVIAVVDA